MNVRWGIIFQNNSYHINVNTPNVSRLFGQKRAEMPSVTFLQYVVLFFGENTSKILQDFGKYCFFSKFITTHVY